MKILLGCIAAAALLTGCATYSDGYYDRFGNYHSYTGYSGQYAYGGGYSYRYDPYYNRYYYIR